MTTNARADSLQGWERSGTAILGIGVIGVLIIMIIPLPTFLLDLLLSFNITISIVILLMSMYVLRPLDLSSFPSILLTVTLLRLSLNVASTRFSFWHLYLFWEIFIPPFFYLSSFIYYFFKIIYLFYSLFGLIFC